MRIEDAATGARADIALGNSRDAAAQVGDGYVVYPHAHESGATVLHRPMPDGFEDFVSFDERPRKSEVAYQLTIGDKIEGLRLIEGTLELLDASGAPRLRATPPFLVDADGKRTEATLAVDGCAVDRNPAPPWGRRVEPTGASTCTVRVSWKDDGVAYPAVLDPRWTTTGLMTIERHEHTATLLANGQVLVVGGRSSTTVTTALDTAEIYNPANNTWASTASISGARRLHSATLLPTSANATTSGKVLVAGGITGTTPSINTARLFDPATGTWNNVTATMNAGRHMHTATLLASGQVLLAGGMTNGNVASTAAAMRYNPATGTGTWTNVGSGLSPRRAHTATRLVVPGNPTLNNKVLIVGGNSGSSDTSLDVDTVQLFDGTSTWTTPAAIALAIPREGHTAIALANGNVLVTGGKSGADTNTLNSAILFNAISGSGSWSSAGTMTSARQGHTATLPPNGIVADGQALVIGGSSNGTNTLGTAEFWNGTTGWATTTALPGSVRGHTATLLANGSILIAGGRNGSPVLRTASIYDPSFALGCTSGSQCTSGFCANGVCCDSACSGQCSACNLPGLVGTCSPKATGTACDDANACTVGDACSAGACQPASTITCTAPDACHTAGTCNPAAAPPGPSSTQDLVGWWKLDGDGQDASGGGHHLTNDGAVAAPGRFGLGMKFNGNACMTIPAWQEAQMQGSTGFTIMAWVNPSDGSVCPIEAAMVAGKGRDYAAATHCRSWSTPNEQYITGTGVGFGYPGGWGGAFRNTWTLLTVTWDHQSLNLFFNGKFVAWYPQIANPGMTQLDSVFSIGCAKFGNLSPETRAQPFNGTIDDVMLYRRPLTAVEIAAYYAASDPCPHDAQPNGTACNDGNACTQSDTCQTGACVGGNPVTCAAPDQCHTAGTCNPTTGVCSSAVKPDGATCNDGAACTQSETCVAGSCTGTSNYPTVLNLPVTNLGSLGLIQSAAVDINASGTVTGWSSISDVPSIWDTLHAWKYTGSGPLVDLTTIAPFGTRSAPTAINDAGTIVGQNLTANGHRAFRYSATGVLEDLATDGEMSSASDINDAGQIAIHGTTGGIYHGYRYTEGIGYEDVGNRGGGTTLSGISESGRVVGSSWTQGDPPSSGHAVMYENEVIGLVDLDSYIDDPDNEWELVNAVATSGDFVIGDGVRAGKTTAFRLRVSTHAIEPIDGGWEGDWNSGQLTATAAKSVNGAGDMVGWGIPTPGLPPTAFVYTDQLGFKKLNDLIPTTPSWYFLYGTSINAFGDIVGVGYAPYQPGVVEGPQPFRLRLPPGQAATCQARGVCGGPGTICLYSDGVAQKPDGSYVAIFGYDSSAATSITPTQNEVWRDGMRDTSPQPAPPAVLPSGTHPGAFLATLAAGQSVSWKVDGQTVTEFASNPSRVLPTVPVGTSGYGVMIGGKVVTIQSDLAPWSQPPPDPTVSQDQPAVGAEFLGTLTGQLGVSPSGAATYSVPIAIPPGVAGMAPNLSLVYNSQGGDGIAGQGWELGGLSMIQRCPKTRLQGGRARAVHMNRWDQSGGDEGQIDGLCLDGKEMFERAPGQYETPDLDYSTIARSTDYQTFTVTTKTGEVRYYGFHADGRVSFPREDDVDQGTEIAVWALDRVEDAWGNYYDIHYDPDVAGNGLIVRHIDYTGHVPGISFDENGLPHVDSELPTFQSITFDYGDRPDVRTIRFRSSTIQRKKRLTKVTVNQTPEIFYRLSYPNDTADATLPSRLEKIEYCAASNPCLELAFDWDGGEYHWEETPGFELPVAIDAQLVGQETRSPRGTQFADLNGDGRVDFMQAVDGVSSSAWRNTGQTWEQRNQWALPVKLYRSDGRPAGARLADVDGDGMFDVVSDPSSGTGCQPQSGQRLCVWLNRIKQNPTCSTAAQCWERSNAFGTLPAGWGLNGAITFAADSPTAPFRDFLADMNGDGRADLARLGLHYNGVDPDLYVLLATPVGWTSSPANYFGGQFTDSLWAVHPEDINRDGLADLVPNGADMSETHPFHVDINRGANGPSGTAWEDVMFSTYAAGGDMPPGARVQGDVDGDGRYDIVWDHLTITNGQGEHKDVLGATGLGYSRAGMEGYLSAIPGPSQQLADYQFGMADLNADGLADFIDPQLFWGRPFFNSGTAWIPQTYNAAPPLDSRLVPVMPTEGDPKRGAAFVDLDGDGVTDLVQSSWNSFGFPNQLVNHAWLNKFRPPVIVKFPNGLAKKSEVAYEVITTAAAQQTAQPTYRDTGELVEGTTYLAAPLRVVASVLADDGRGFGTMATARYQYEDLRGSATGRGPQGFRTTKVTTPAGITTITTHAQAHPYTGLPTVVTRQFNLPSAGTAVTLTKTETRYCAEISADSPSFSFVCTFADGTASGGTSPAKVSAFVHPWKVTDTTYLHKGEIPALQTPDELIAKTSFTYDGYGNPTNTVVTTETVGPDAEKYEKVIVNDFGPPGSTEQRMGKITRTTATSRRLVPPDTNPPIENKTEFEYGTVNLAHPPGLPLVTLGLKKKIVEPNGGPSVEQHTVYAYDRFGNVTTTTSCANDFVDCRPGATGPVGTSDPAHLPFRTTRVSYDPNDFNAPVGPGLLSTTNYGRPGRFPVRATNAEGHQEYSLYEVVRGNMVQKTAPNGSHACYAYDDYGRRLTETARCGSTLPDEPPLVTVFEQRRTASSVEGAVVTIARPPTGSPTWVFTDVLGRKIETRERGFDGRLISAKTVYDALGRVGSETKPHIVGDAEYGTVPQYDEIGRIRRVTDALGHIDDNGNASSVVTTDYQGGIVITTRNVTNELGQPVQQQRREKKNALGKVAWVEDATQQEKINYEYDSAGQLLKTIDPANNVVAIHYDKRGRKDSNTDPDMGTWTYTYDAFGDLVSQTDAKFHTTAMTYDRLGRMTRKADSAGEAQWVYDVAPGGVGQLASMMSAPDTRLNGECDIPYTDPNLVGNRAGRSFSYSQHGALLETAECTDGTTFRTNLEYDTFGRQRIMRYPQVGDSRLAVEYHYTSQGYLHYLTDVADGGVYWAATAVNALKQVTQEYTRNGVETVSTRNPSTGWLMGSTSVANADAETMIQDWSYRYDQIGNLRSRMRADSLNGPPSTESFTYDVLNRVKTSRVVMTGYNVEESFDYDSLGNIMQKGGNTYTYTGCMAENRPAGPHAVCSVGSGAAFAYDRNGNMASGSDRSVTYNDGNKPILIQKGSSSADFIYGADGHRVVQQLGRTGGASARTVYVGLGGTGKSVYEKTVEDGKTEHAHFLYAGGAHGGAAFALRIVTEGTPTPSTSTKYYHVDHLGSVTAMSDESGHVISASWGGVNAGAMGYDPWGARRNPDGTAAVGAAFKQQAGRREYTGHETIPDVGLINMNGRVYDPALGRFLSPDPNVQFNTDLQSYNRYSYVLNNPLRNTDPTGYFSITDALGYAGIHSFSDGIFLGWGLFAAAACVGTSGAACAVITVITTLESSLVMMSNGASLSQVVTMNAIGLGAGFVGGAIAGQALGQTLQGQLVGGALSGAISGAVTTAVYGGDLGENMLMGATSGAVGAALSWGVQQNVQASQASAVEAQGGGGTGATELEAQSRHPPGTLVAVVGDDLSVLNTDEAKQGQAAGRSARRASNIEDTRSAIARAAEAKLVEADPSYQFESNHRPRGTRYDMPNPSWKCSCFVYDTIYDTAARYDHTISANLLAGQGGGEVPPGFLRVAGDGARGDIVALSRASESGHAGIVVGPRTAIAAGQMGVERTDFFWHHTMREQGPFFLRWVGK